MENKSGLDLRVTAKLMGEFLPEDRSDAFLDNSIGVLLDELLSQIHFIIWLPNIYRLSTPIIPPYCFALFDMRILRQKNPNYQPH